MKEFEKKWQSRFQRYGRHHQTDHLISGWSERGLRRRLVLFEKLLSERVLPTPAQALDLGCGAGNYVRLLSGLKHRVVGLDYSIPTLHRALESDSQRVGMYVGGGAYNLPFKDGSFDLVVSIGVFQVLNCVEKALHEMIRVLKPKGLLVIEFLNALEVIALSRAIAERITGRRPRLYSYTASQVQGLFIQHGLKILRRAGVYIPPRRFAWLERILNLEAFVGVMEGIPGLASVVAHAFILVGEKESG